MKSVYTVHKEIGETPLEALERFRQEKIEQGNIEFKGLPMTYAGRLDPLAEGPILILVGDECKNKDAYTNLDKEYELEILFGVSTDTGDLLGLVNEVKDFTAEFDFSSLDKYVGKFTQEYPMYSSKTVNGKQLHTWAREGATPEEMPTKEVEIYSIKLEKQLTINGEDVTDEVDQTVPRVKGDFRQKEILERFHEKLKPDMKFRKIRIVVLCSSGTYMRSLAVRMGKDLGIPSLAYRIVRRRIVE
jgi:tRNA pseudouridine(55) synthase